MQLPIKITDSTMQTLASCITEMEQAGFITQFQMTREGLRSHRTARVFQPGDIKVRHFFRFEGESDPDDNAILFAIETNNLEKGTLVDGYGISNDSEVSDFMHEVAEINK